LIGIFGDRLRKWIGGRRAADDRDALLPNAASGRTAWPDALLPLFPEDPYAGFNAEEHPEDLQGWASTDPIFEDAIRAVRPDLIIEVGSWKGASAIHMADLCRAMALGTKILCVDTWLGSPEHLLPPPDRDHWRTSLKIKHGFPQLYFTFLANVVRHGHTERILPLPLPSESAAEVLGQLGVEGDIIYIDAAHEYAPARRDYEAFWPLVSDRGAMIGDDYAGKFAGVTNAANDFSHHIERPLIVRRNKFAIDKAGTFNGLALT
jgi:hypothetical protein